MLMCRHDVKLTFRVSLRAWRRVRTDSRPVYFIPILFHFGLDVKPEFIVLKYTCVMSPLALWGLGDIGSMKKATDIRKRSEDLSRFGSKGGKRSLVTMTPSERRARALKAVAAREAKRKTH
jgi:hypothetical protein